ncbi:MAG TPA: lipopolysaccharide assembly protein LapA domain-containing protein [Cellulomonas sp.]
MPVQPEPSHPAVEDEPRLVAAPVEVDAAPRPALQPPARTRTGAAWVGICVGALVLVALIVFMMQNTAPVEVAFLGMHGSAPLALMLLIAGVGVGIVALVVGTLRIGQLKRRLRAGSRLAAPAPPLGV